MRWTIEFDGAGLLPGEVRMVAAVIDGDLRMLRLALPVTCEGPNESEEREIAENVCRMVVDEFPHIAFRVVATGEEDTVKNGSAS